MTLGLVSSLRFSWSTFCYFHILQPINTNLAVAKQNLPTNRLVLLSARSGPSSSGSPFKTFRWRRWPPKRVCCCGARERWGYFWWFDQKIYFSIYLQLSTHFLSLFLPDCTVQKRERSKLPYELEGWPGSVRAHSSSQARSAGLPQAHQGPSAGQPQSRLRPCREALEYTENVGCRR